MQQQSLRQICNFQCSIACVDNDKLNQATSLHKTARQEARIYVMSEIRLRFWKSNSTGDQLLTHDLLAGLLGYFWNAGETFDFVIVVASLAALISGKYPNLNMARVFRYLSSER